MDRMALQSDELLPKRTFDETFDVIVIGYGYSGATAAIEAADAGARVLVLEKMPDPGGISICSGGSLRCADDYDDALAYLEATNEGTTPVDVLQVLAHAMVDLPDYVARLAADVGRKTSSSEHAGKKGGNYPFPGWETFYHVIIEDTPDFDQKGLYPHVRARPGAPGPRLFKVMQDNVEKRSIDVRLNAPVRKLIGNASRGVVGVVTHIDGAERMIGARRAVILACGGFEANEEMKKQYWSGRPVLTAANRGNTGDGIRMAQSLGADLWHMWHYHGCYGFKHPDPQFPYALRVKRLPDWNPARKDQMQVKMVWIVVDRSGRRYMNECPPYTQDTSARPMQHFDPETMSYPRIPSYLICDESGRKMYPLGDARTNDRDYTYDWSDSNEKEIANGILRRADSLAGLAKLLKLDEGALTETVARWNRACAAGRDDDFGRPAGTMFPIRNPPFYAGEVWPVVSNTQGGPVHDSRQRILNVDGEPIPRLFAAGEMGSSFGHLYLSGGNVSECFATGIVAGREAASLAPLN